MKKNFLEKREWKNKNSQYLFELQKFLDLADNIEDEKLKKLIISQMLKCDTCITNIAEEMIRRLREEKEFKMEE